MTKKVSNEKTGTKAGTIASKVLRDVKVSKKELKTLAGSALTQRPNKKK
jgi:hypothetical protein